MVNNPISDVDDEATVRRKHLSDAYRCCFSVMSRHEMMYGIRGFEFKLASPTECPVSVEMLPDDSFFNFRIRSGSRFGLLER